MHFIATIDVWSINKRSDGIDLFLLGSSLTLAKLDWSGKWHASQGLSQVGVERIVEGNFNGGAKFSWVFFTASLGFMFRSQSDIVVNELAKLGDHVCCLDVGGIAIGMDSRTNQPSWWQKGWGNVSVSKLTFGFVTKLAYLGRKEGTFSRKSKVLFWIDITNSVCSKKCCHVNKGGADVFNIPTYRSNVSLERSGHSTKPSILQIVASSVNGSKWNRWVAVLGFVNTHFSHQFYCLYLFAHTCKRLIKRRF